MHEVHAVLKPIQAQLCCMQKEQQVRCKKHQQPAQVIVSAQHTGSAEELGEELSLAGIAAMTSILSFSPSSAHTQHTPVHSTTACVAGGRVLLLLCAVVLPAVKQHPGHSPIRPYSARASAKMRIRIIPTNSLGCCAFALQQQQRQQQSLCVNT